MVIPKISAINTIVNIAVLRNYSFVADNIISHRVLLVHIYHLWNNARRQNTNASFTGHQGSIIPQQLRAYATGVST
jgi:hypothetical protein